LRDVLKKMARDRAEQLWDYNSNLSWREVRKTIYDEFKPALRMLFNNDMEGVKAFIGGYGIPEKNETTTLGLHIGVTTKAENSRDSKRVKSKREALGVGHLEGVWQGNWQR
jgi:hypothetical protein